MNIYELPHAQDSDNTVVSAILPRFVLQAVPLICKASVVQIGYTTPTRRFSDTLLVLRTCSVYPLNRLVGVV